MELNLIAATDEFTHIALVGKMDAMAADEIGDRFTAQVATRRNHCVVDMSEVNFIASLGFRVLVGSQRSLAHHEKKLVLLNPQELVAETIKQAGMDELLPMVSDLDEAKAIFGSA